MRLLLTGAFGFVGVNLVRGLAAKPGVTVVATDLHEPDAHMQQFLAPVSSAVTVLSLDVTERAAVLDLVRAEEITHILHAAALTPTQEQERVAPERIVDVNLGGTHNLLLAALRAAHVQRVLTVSSSGVYGAPRPGVRGLQVEEGELALDNLYAITKYSSELLTRRFRQLSGKAMAAIRLGAIYGPMERPSASRPNLSQPGQLARAVQEERPVTVAGPDVLRDWTFASDVAEAVWALFAAERWQYALYNMSCGAGLSFRQVVDTFVAHGLQASWTPDVEAAAVSMLAQDERRPLDVRRLHEDTDNQLVFTDFAQGVARLLH